MKVIVLVKGGVIIEGELSDFAPKWVPTEADSYPPEIRVYQLHKTGNGKPALTFDRYLRNGEKSDGTPIYGTIGR